MVANNIFKIFLVFFYKKLKKTCFFYKKSEIYKKTRFFILHFEILNIL